MPAPKPTPPTAGYDFSDFQTTNPSTPLPGGSIDSEFASLFAFAADVVAWVEQTLNDSGALRGETVGEAQLAPDVFSATIASLVAATETHSNTATAAAAAAVSAQGDAEAAAAAALLSQGYAAGFATDAQTAKVLAEAARDTTLGYRDTASGYATASSNSANSASGHAAAALLSHQRAYRWAEYLDGPIIPLPSEEAYYTSPAEGPYYSARWWANYTEGIASDIGDAVTAAEAARDAAVAAQAAAVAAQGLAETAQAGAEAAETDAEAALTTFQGVWLGAQAADPLVDLNGDPLGGGEVYVNSGSGNLRVYVAGPGWLDAGPAEASQVTFENLDANGDVGGGADQVAAGDHTHAAATVTFTPAGSVAAVTVQAAIEELDSEVYAALGALTGADIAFTPAGTIAAATVQAAIEELDSEVYAAIGALTGADIAFTPAGTIASGTVQAAIEELDSEVYAAIGALSYSAADISFTPAGSIAAANVQAAIVELDSEVYAALGALGTMASQDATGVAITGGTISGLTALSAAATAQFQSINLVPATPTADAFVQVGQSRSGSGNSYFDLIGDTTYPDYGARFIRLAGATGQTQLVHRGTGAFAFVAAEQAEWSVWTDNVKRLAISGDGNTITVEDAAAWLAAIGAEAADADILKADVNDILTAGFGLTMVDDGDKNSGTYTPGYAGGNAKFWGNTGAHALGVPATPGVYVGLMENKTGAGALTTSAWTAVDGDALTTTVGHHFWFLMLVLQNDSAATKSFLWIKAAQ